MKCTLTVGISGSGKSTWAKEQIEAPGSCVYVTNRDELRWQISGKIGWKDYKFNRATEDLVTAMQMDSITLASKGKRDVIIADTNLNPVTRKKLTEFCESLGYIVELKEFPITLEEAWQRDRFRGEFSVGREVLYKQWQQWLDYSKRKRYTPNRELPDAVIFDVDGTLAHMNGKRGAFEWDKVYNDTLDSFVRDMVIFHAQDNKHIIVLSGRDGIARKDTADWLRDSFIPFDKLFMRVQGDYRKDSVIKEEIFWRDIAPVYNVLAVVDDRPQVVRMWHDIGIPKVICVGNPWIEF